MLKKLEKWLLTPAKTLQDKIQVTTTSFLLNMIWLVIIVGILRFVNTTDIWQIKAFFYSCIMAPLWEELAFRVLPVAVAKIIDERLILPVLGISILLFGWGHGNGTDSLLIQGVSGVFLSVIYVKTNFNYWAAVSTHFAWNFWLIFLT